MSWYVDGDSPVREEFIKNSYHSKLFNFFMKKGETKELIFLDDAKFGIREHKMQVNGLWKPYTCAGAGCGFCGAEKPMSYTEYYSILDMTPFKDKDNKERKYSRRPLGVVKDVAAILKSRRSDAGGSLIGAKFRVSRTGEKSPACGNDWVFLSKVDLSKVPAEHAKAFDFKEALRPRSPEEIASILNHIGRGEAATVSRSELGDPGPAASGSPPLDDNDIPF